MSARAPAPPAPPAPLVGDGGDGDDDECGHLPVVTYTRRWRDLFRKRYVVRCWGCSELRLGPFETWAMANAERQDVEAAAWADLHGDDDEQA